MASLLIIVIGKQQNTFNLFIKKQYDTMLFMKKCQKLSIN